MTMALVAAVLGLVMYQELAGVREGTFISALLVGSALLVVAKIPPYWGENTSVVGMFGFLISGGLSLVILIADHRQRRNFLKERVRRRREDAQKLHK